jgi:hypothetical protein
MRVFRRASDEQSRSQPFSEARPGPDFRADPRFIRVIRGLISRLDLVALPDAKDGRH